MRELLLLKNNPVLNLKLLIFFDGFKTRTAFRIKVRSDMPIFPRGSTDSAYVPWIDMVAKEGETKKVKNIADS